MDIFTGGAVGREIALLSKCHVPDDADGVGSGGKSDDLPGVVDQAVAVSLCGIDRATSSPRVMTLSCACRICGMCCAASAPATDTEEVARECASVGRRRRVSCCSSMIAVSTALY